MTHPYFNIVNVFLKFARTSSFSNFPYRVPFSPPVIATIRVGASHSQIDSICKYNSFQITYCESLIDSYLITCKINRKINYDSLFQYLPHSANSEPSLLLWSIIFVFIESQTNRQNKLTQIEGICQLIHIKSRWIASRIIFAWIPLLRTNFAASWSWPTDCGSSWKDNFKKMSVTQHPSTQSFWSPKYRQYRNQFQGTRQGIRQTQMSRGRRKCTMQKKNATTKH